jgi:pre-mRNA-splicing factor ATP-dependent RNA helicase DHX15/PRP43
MSSNQVPQEPKPMVLRKKLVKPQTKRDKLPIANYEHDFIKRLEREKILVVEASTGSGKSTQLPQYVAKSDLFQSERRKVGSEIKYGGNKSPLGLATQGKMVVSTQPNAFAAAAVATRVGFEYDDDHLGRKVGLITPTESKFDPTQCEILFVSDSELVRIMTQDKLLSRVGVLIIDEAHERTLYTDVIMTLAKEIREQREDFYIVISSATIEVKRFLSFMFNIEDATAGAQTFHSSKQTLGFRPTPLTVQGKTYEVSVSYDPMEVRDPTSEKDPYLSQILTPKLAQVLRKNLNREVKGHALVFVEDTHTVLRVVHHLRRYLRLQTKLANEQGIDPANTTKFLTSENTRVIPLYLSMPLKEQQKIMDFVRSFQGGKEIRYVFVADNVAETSITLPDVKLVIDTGRMMVSHYDMMRRLMVTEETFVSKDRAAQRQGRTGRTSPGMFIIFVIFASCFILSIVVYYFF